MSNQREPTPTAKNKAELSSQQKDAIISESIELCKWISWIREESGNPERSVAVRQVERLKRKIEQLTGKAIQSYK